MLGSFAVGFGAFFIFVIVLAISLRVIRASAFLVFIVVSVIVHAIFMLAAAAVIADWSYWYFAATYWFAVLVDLFLMGAFSKSVTLLMLQSIYRNPQKTIPSEDLYRKFVLGKFEERVRLLVHAGEVEESDGKFKIAVRGQKNVEIWHRLQRLFGIESSGLYFRDNASLFPYSNAKAHQNEIESKPDFEEGVE